MLSEWWREKERKRGRERGRERGRQREGGCVSTNAKSWEISTWKGAPGAQGDLPGWRSHSIALGLLAPSPGSGGLHNHGPGCYLESRQHTAAGVRPPAPQCSAFTQSHCPAGGCTARRRNRPAELPPETDGRFCTLPLCPVPLPWDTPASRFKFSLNRCCVPKKPAPSLKPGRKSQLRRDISYQEGSPGSLGRDKNPKSWMLISWYLWDFSLERLSSRTALPKGKGKETKGGREGRDPTGQGQMCPREGCSLTSTRANCHPRMKLSVPDSL